MQTYTVQDGDCMSSIAAQFGRSWQSLWQDPSNAALRQLRGDDPNTLVAGGGVSIPDPVQGTHPAPAAARHHFLQKGVPTKLRLRLLKAGQVRANARYTLKLDTGDTFAGQLTGRGLLTVTIPSNARSGELRVGKARDPYWIDLGTLEPTTTVRGIKQRLNNLGYWCGPADQATTPELQAALAKFQRAHADKGLKPTGQVDGPTRDALTTESAAGSSARAWSESPAAAAAAGPYLNHDQSPMRLTGGAHGIGAVVHADEVKPYHTALRAAADGAPAATDATLLSEKEMRAELQAANESFPDASNFSARRGASGLIAPPVSLDRGFEFCAILYGHLHPYPSTLWPSIAPVWHQQLVKEGQLLDRSLGDVIEILRGYLHADGRVEMFVRGTSNAVARLSGSIATHSAFLREKLELTAYTDVPDESKYLQLRSKAKSLTDGLAGSTDSRYRTLFDAALAYHRIWDSCAKLDKQFADHRNAVIHGAEASVKGFTLVESASFSMLDLAAQAYAMGDPIREAAYRLSVAALHAASKGAGQMAAGDTGWPAAKAVLDEMAAEAPGILASAIVKLVCRRLSLLQRETNLQSAARALITAVMTSVIAAIEDVVVKAHDELPAALQRELENAIFNGVVDFAVALVIPTGGAVTDARRKLIHDRLAVVVHSVLKSLYADLQAARARDGQDHCGVAHAFIAELPWTLARMITSIAVGFTHGAMDEQVKAEAASGQTRFGFLHADWKDDGQKSDGSPTPRLHRAANPAPPSPPADDQAAAAPPAAAASPPRTTTAVPLTEDDHAVAPPPSDPRDGTADTVKQTYVKANADLVGQRDEPDDEAVPPTPPAPKPPAGEGAPATPKLTVHQMYLKANEARAIANFHAEEMSDIEHAIGQLDTEIPEAGPGEPGHVTVALFSGYTPQHGLKNQTAAQIGAVDNPGSVRVVNPGRGADEPELLAQQRSPVKVINDTAVGKLLAQLEDQPHVKALCNAYGWRNVMRPLWAKASVEIVARASGVLLMYDDGAPSDGVLTEYELPIAVSNTRISHVQTGARPEGGRASERRDSYSAEARKAEFFPVVSYLGTRKTDVSLPAYQPYDERDTVPGGDEPLPPGPYQPLVTPDRYKDPTSTK